MSSFCGRRHALGIVFIMASVYASPHAANAQLRSLNAIKYVTLAPPALGDETLHQQVTDHFRRLGMLITSPDTLPPDEPSWPWSDPPARARYAHCALRTNLARPSTTGLECFDYAGQHVGTRTFGDVDEFRRWAASVWAFNTPGARPLTTLRYVVVAPRNRDRDQIVTYVKTLLRKETKFIVLDSDDSVPNNERDDFAWCEITPSPYSVNGTAFARLALKDRFGRAIRVFDVAWAGSFWTPRRRKLERAMDEAVRRLVIARANDEETYRVPTEIVLPELPPSVPSR